MHRCAVVWVEAEKHSAEIKALYLVACLGKCDLEKKQEFGGNEEN